MKDNKNAKAQIAGVAEEEVDGAVNEGDRGESDKRESEKFDGMECDEDELVVAEKRVGFFKLREAAAKPVSGLGRDW
jgi:hypothetical protein